MTEFYGFIYEKNFIVNNFIKNSLPNSIIFSGQKGIGKKTLVFNVLKEIYNLSFQDNNISHNINLINNNTHPNIKYITKAYDDKNKKVKKFITIEQIRNLNSFYYESSLDGMSKFIIIDSSDDLNISSSNSLLKILEEPRKNTYIFLISHKISTLLPTIRSRCLKLKFKNLNFKDFKFILNEKLDINNDEKIKFLYDLTHGSPGMALKLDDDLSGMYEQILESIVDNDHFSENNIILSAKISKFEEDKFKIILSLFKFILINLNKCKLGINIFDYYLSKNMELLYKASNKITITSIFDKYEYLIKNENDLFDYNLDRNNFILNFFSYKKY